MDHEVSAGANSAPRWASFGIESFDNEHWVELFISDGPSTEGSRVKAH
jgi:hypothetical protein